MARPYLVVRGVLVRRVVGEHERRVQLGTGDFEAVEADAAPSPVEAWQQQGVVDEERESSMRS